MKSYEFDNLDEVGIDLICNVFNKMLSDEMVGVAYFNYNNYEWCVGVDVVRIINDLNGHRPLPNSILGIQVIKSYTIKPNEIVLRISPRLYEIDGSKEESKKDKVIIGDMMPGYRYVDTDEAGRIKSITNDEKKHHEKALDRLKNTLNNVYGDSLDALRYSIEAAKFFNFNIKEKESNTMPTNYNKMFLGTGNLYFRFKAEIKDVIFNNPATIILWNDDTKTVVKCGEGEVYDPEKGLAMAIAKKFLGNQGNYYDTFKKYLPVKDEEIKESDSFKKDINSISETLDTCKDIPRGFVTLKEFAKLTEQSEDKVRSDIKAGLLPAKKIKGKWQIPW